MSLKDVPPDGKDGRWRTLATHVEHLLQIARERLETHGAELYADTFVRDGIKPLAVSNDRESAENN